MKIALILSRWTGRKPASAVSLADLYPTDDFPLWIRTWPDGWQDVLNRDGTMRRVPARHDVANQPDFEATGVARYSPLFPFEREPAS